METPTRRPWWSYVRFSLRGLIVLVLVFGGWLGWLVRTAHVQRDAVAAIRKAGGSVTYDWAWKDGQPIPNGRPWAPRWLVDWLGADYFGSVICVSDGTSEWSDADLVPIGHLGRLEKLALNSRRLTGTGLAHLKGLTNLQSLNLYDSQVGDAGLVFLEGLTQLRSLFSNWPGRGAWWPASGGCPTRRRTS
jgi:hypothetical protein